MGVRARTRAAMRAATVEPTVATSVASFLASPPAAPYDVVFSDPPYPMPDADVDADLVALVAHGWLVPCALVLARHRRPP